MRVVTFQIVKEHGVLEMPVVASHVTVGVSGSDILAGGMFVMVVSHPTSEGFLADAAIFDLPVIGDLFRREYGKVVLAEIFVGFIRALLDVGHILLHELMFVLFGRTNPMDLLKDLVTVLHGPDELVETKRQDLVNGGGGFKFWEWLEPEIVLVDGHETGLEV